MIYSMKDWQYGQGLIGDERQARGRRSESDKMCLSNLIVINFLSLISKEDKDPRFQTCHLVVVGWFVSGSRQIHGISHTTPEHVKGNGSDLGPSSELKRGNRSLTRKPAKEF